MKFLTYTIVILFVCLSAGNAGANDLLRIGLLSTSIQRFENGWDTPSGVNRLLASTLSEWILTASDGMENAYFGADVCLDGETIVIGADGDYLDTGSIYIYEKIDGQWFETKLTAEDQGFEDAFGGHVAIDQNILAVSAVGESSKGYNTGAVYIFEKIDGEWSQTTKLYSSAPASFSYFGASVAVSGKTIAVGAPGDDAGGLIDRGKVAIFEKKENSWINTYDLTALDGEAGDEFGASVSIYLNTVVVGARAANNGQDQKSGAVYIFGNQSGVWTEKSKLTASDSEAEDEFGASVTINGKRLLIGATGDDDNGENAGASYLFNQINGNWIEETKFTASDGSPGDQFGVSVALNGGFAIMGADGDTSGSVYIFENTGAGWEETAKLTASDRRNGDRFGSSLALDSENLLIGAPDADEGMGKAYLYQIKPEATPTPTFTPTSAFTATSTPSPTSTPTPTVTPTPTNTPTSLYTPTAPPPPVLTADAGEDAVMNYGHRYRMRSSFQGGSGEYHFSWDIISGPDRSLEQFSPADVQNPQFSPAEIGLYIVRFTVTDASQTAEDVVTILCLGIQEAIISQGLGGSTLVNFRNFNSDLAPRASILRSFQAAGGSF